MQIARRSISVALVSAMLALVPNIVSAQDSKKPPKKLDVVRPIPETKADRDAFSGSESRIAAMNFVNADCSSGPVPNLRIVTPPQNGEYRLEEITIPVDRKADNSRAVCNGKPVKAVGVFYKSKPDFIGYDSIIVDVDFKRGVVRRFSYKITVR